MSEVFHCTVPGCPWTYTPSDDETMDSIRAAWRLHWDAEHAGRWSTLEERMTWSTGRERTAARRRRFRRSPSGGMRAT